MKKLWKQVIYVLRLVWESWDLRIVILSSLLLQTFLIFCAPMRKRTVSSYVIRPMWLAYSLADAAANFAVGLISKGLGDSSNSGPFANPELVAFWAPFLLLHLGGPDTITAFSLEDNELWHRHLLQLVFQCVTSAYVFLLSLSKNKLWLPTLLMFFAGFIKYTERIYSLYLASWRSFRESLLTEPDPGPNYDKLMDEYFAKKEINLPVRIEHIPQPNSTAHAADDEDQWHRPLEDLQVVQHGYRFYQTFKGLIADLIFGFRERDQSRNFFLKRSARDAFKIVEVELNFLYEVLFTKVPVMRGNLGYLFRLISFILTVAALVLFHLMIDKHRFHKFDVGISYTLLLSPIALDMVGLFMTLSSDWTTVALTKPTEQYSTEPASSRILRKLLNVDRERWPNNEDSRKQHSTCSLGWFRQLSQRRWSESISQFNLIYYCLHPRSKNMEKILGRLGLTNILDGMKYVRTKQFNIRLRDFIFEELKLKSEFADDIETAKEICSAKGDWVLAVEGCDSLLPYIQKADYDESLILWHIATELCHNTERVTNAKTDGFREISKLLSDYMLYLLIMEPNVMSAVAGIGHIRFRDTCAEAKRFIESREIGKGQVKNKSRRVNIPSVDKCFSYRKSQLGGHKKKHSGKKMLQIIASANILDVNTNVKPVYVKGDLSKSLLFDASILAKELDKLGEERKWEMLSKVWVELLSYAACHCRASNHAAQLSKGGQLISLVWLLMVHLGLGDHFQVLGEHPRTKLSWAK